MKRPPFPRVGGILFRDDLPDWQNNACLNSAIYSDQSYYSDGYLTGARYLVEQVVDTHQDQDVLVYPIVFFYRHHIELALKTQLTRSACLLHRELTAVEKRHLRSHRLDVLWADLKPLLPVIWKSTGWPLADAPDDRGVAEHIRQLSELDPDSSRFRYTRLNTGEPSLPANLLRFNVRHFAEMMERLASYFRSVDAATSGLETAQSEMEAEWRRDMAGYMSWE